MKEKFTLEELRSFLHEADKGQILDSFFAVELGLDVYATYWDAHQDSLDLDPQDATLEMVSLPFLVEIGIMTEVESIDFDKIIGAPHA